MHIGLPSFLEVKTGDDRTAAPFVFDPTQLACTRLAVTARGNAATTDEDRAVFVVARELTRSRRARVR